MAARSMLLRGFAVLFSMTLVGIYIYTRAGGKLPAALGGSAADDGVPVMPVDDMRFGGSKSAAVFEPATPSQQPAPQLMPGSKSLVLSSSGSTVTPNTANSPPQLLPDSKYIVIPQARPRILPGSKADTVFKPSNVDSSPAPQPPEQVQAEQAASPAALPKKQELLPRSKRQLIFTKDSFEAQPKPQEPPKKQLLLPGSKSRARIIDEKDVQQATRSSNKAE